MKKTLIAVITTFLLNLSSEQGNITKLNGIDIWWESHGDINNPTALLIMGLNSNSKVWSDQYIENLVVNNLHVLVFDNRDIGKSTWITEEPGLITFIKYLPNFLQVYFVEFIFGFIFDEEGKFNMENPAPAEYNLSDMAMDGIALLDHLEISEAHIIGASMGGMIAQVLTSDNPSRVKSLTLIASTASTPHPFNAPLKKVRKVMMERSRYPNPTFNEFYQREITFVELIGRKDLVVDTPEFKKLTRDNFERASDGSGYGRQLLAILASRNRLQKVKKIKSPTLIIHGRDDPMIHLRNALKMQNLIPHSQLEIIEHMRHLIDPESLDEIASLLLKHLRESS